jgi:uncharacterized protein YqgV (UPF0045/DUF77 family)
MDKMSMIASGAFSPNSNTIPWLELAKHCSRVQLPIVIINASTLTEDELLELLERVRMANKSCNKLDSEESNHDRFKIEPSKDQDEHVDQRIESISDATHKSKDLPDGRIG